MNYSDKGTVFGMKGVPDFEDFYVNHMDVWRQIYGGYYPAWHRVGYKTVDGMSRERRMLSAGMAKALCAELAGLTWNEKCLVEVYEKGKGTHGKNDRFNNFIEDVLLKNSFYTEMQDLVETAYAMGGGCVKVFFDEEIRLDYVPAHRFVPISRECGTVVEGMFINHLEKDGKRYVLLESHLKSGSGYLIKNELFESDFSGQPGRQLDVSGLFPNLSEGVEIKGLKQPLFVYFRPNIANNIEDGSPLGISVFANALDTLRAIDVCFDSLNREFVLGKKRIIVPATAVRTVLDPSTKRMVRYFDVNDEVFQAMDFDENDSRVVDNSVELRVEEHIASINALLAILAIQTGLTVGTLSISGSGGVKTATEIVTENSKTYKTVKSHENVLSEAIYRLIDVIILVGRMYGLISFGAYESSVRFDETIIDNRDSELKRCISLVEAGLMSKYTAMVDVLAYTPTKAEEEIERIYKELGMSSEE